LTSIQTAGKVRRVEIGTNPHLGSVPLLPSTMAPVNAEI